MKVLEVMDIFILFIVVIVSWVYACQILSNCILCVTVHILYIFIDFYRLIMPQ